MVQDKETRFSIVEEAPEFFRSNLFVASNTIQASSRDTLNGGVTVISTMRQPWII